MKNNFNFSRFWLLVQRQWAENKIMYMIIWCLISLLMIYLGLLPYKFDNAVYFFLYCLVGAVIPISTFPRWPDFGRSSGYMLIPASLMEKFLCGLFYGIVLYTIVYCLTYFVMTYLVTYAIIFFFFSNNLLPFHEVITSAIDDTTLPFRSYFVFFITLMFAQSVCMICIIRFKKNRLLIFFLIFFAILILYGIGMHKLMSEFVHTKGLSIIKTPGAFLTFMTPDFGFSGYINHQNIDEHFSFTKLIGDLNRWIWFAVFAMLYLSAWFKFREREL